jgi:cyanate permease
MGRLLDKFSARSLLAGSLALLVGAMLTVQVMATPWQAFFVGGLMGLVSGSFRVMDATVWPKYFGRLHLGAIKGATSISIIGCTALGPFLLGASFDYFGSYSPALNGLLVLPLIISLLAFFIKRPEKETSSS